MPGSFGGGQWAIARYPDAENAVLRVHASAKDVAIMVYDALGREVARGFGDLGNVLLPCGLYRIDAELFGAADITRLDDRAELGLLREPDDPHDA